MDTCRAFRRPPIDVVLNLALNIAIILAYLPQFQRLAQRRSSLGISPYYVLFHAIVSSQQFASTLILYSTPRNILQCIRQKRLQGFDAFGAFIGLVQSFLQWFCAVLFLVFVLCYDTPAIEDTMSFSASQKFLWIFISYAIVILAPALFILLVPDATKNIGPPAFFCGWTVIFFAPLSTLFVVFQAISEILTIWRLQSPFSLSVASLVGQSICFVLLAMSWSIRLRPGMAKRAPGTLSGWYQYGGWIVTNYGGTAVVNMALLLALGLWRSGDFNEKQESMWTVARGAEKSRYVC